MKTMLFHWLLLLYIQYLEAIVILPTSAATKDSLATQSIYSLPSSRDSSNHGEDEPLDLETLIQSTAENRPRTLPTEITNYIYQAHPRKKIDKNTVQIIYNLLYPQWNKWNSSENIECPPTYERVGQTCLSLTCPMESIGWKEARLYCRVIKGGDLAVFNNDVEIAAATHFIRKTDENRHCSYWIGGSDIDNEDDWRWHDGRIMPYGSPPWGQINGKVEPGGAEYENFAMLYNKDNYLIHDIDSEKARNFQVVPLCQIVTSAYNGNHGKNGKLLSQGNSQASIPYKDFIDFLLNDPRINHDHSNANEASTGLDLNSNLTSDVSISSRMKLSLFGNRHSAQNIYAFSASPKYGSKEKRGHSYFNNYKPSSGYRPYNIYQSTNYPSYIDQSNSNRYGKPIYPNNFGNYNEPKPCINCQSQNAEQYGYNNGNNQNNNYNPSYSNGGNNYNSYSTNFGNYNGPKPCNNCHSQYAGQYGYNNGNNQNNDYNPSYSNGGNNYNSHSTNFGNYKGPKPCISCPSIYNGQNGYHTNGNNQNNNYNPSYPNTGNNYKGFNKYENKPVYSHSSSNYGGQYNKYSNGNYNGNDQENKNEGSIRQGSVPSSEITDIVKIYHHYTLENESNPDTNGSPDSNNGNTDINNGNTDSSYHTNNHSSNYQEDNQNNNYTANKQHYSNNGNGQNNNYNTKGLHYNNYGTGQNNYYNGNNKGDNDDGNGQNNDNHGYSKKGNNENNYHKVSKIYNNHGNHQHGNYKGNGHHSNYKGNDYPNGGGNHDNDYREPSYESNNEGNKYKGDDAHYVHDHDSADDIIDIISGIHGYDYSKGTMHHQGHHGGHHSNNYENTHHLNYKPTSSGYNDNRHHHNNHSKGSYDHQNHKGSYKGNGGKPCSKCNSMSGHYGGNHGYTHQHNYKPVSLEIFDNDKGHHHNNHNHGNHQHGNYKGNDHGNYKGNNHHVNYKGNDHHDNYKGNDHHGNYKGNDHHGNYKGNDHHGNYKGNDHHGNYKGNYHHGNYKGNNHHGNYKGNDHHGINRPTSSELIDIISGDHDHNYDSNKGHSYGYNNHGNKDKYENNEDLLPYAGHHYIFDSTRNCLAPEKHHGHDDDDGYDHLYHQIFHNRYGVPYWGRHLESHVDIFREIPICRDRKTGSYKGSEHSKGDQNNPSKGDQIYPSKGDQNYPSKGDQNYPSQGDQNYHFKGMKGGPYIAVHKGGNKGIYVPDKSYYKFHPHHLQHPHSGHRQQQIDIFNEMIKGLKGGLWTSELRNQKDFSRTPYQNVYGYGGALTKVSNNQNYRTANQGSFSEFFRHVAETKSNNPNSKFNGNPHAVHSSTVARILSKFTEFFENEDRQKNTNDNIFGQDQFLSRKNSLKIDSLNQTIQIYPNLPKIESTESPDSSINSKKMVKEENKSIILTPVDDATEDVTPINDKNPKLSFSKRNNTLDKLTNNDSPERKVNITTSTKPSRETSPSVVTTVNKGPEISTVSIKDSVIPYDKTYDYESGSYTKATKANQ